MRVDGVGGKGNNLNIGDALRRHQVANQHGTRSIYSFVAMNQRLPTTFDGTRNEIADFWQVFQKLGVVVILNRFGKVVELTRPPRCTPIEGNNVGDSQRVEHVFFIGSALGPNE